MKNVLLLLIVFFTFGCVDEGNVESVNVPDTDYSSYLFKKDFKLTDDAGNQLRFSMSTNDKVIFDSYSEENFVFRGLTIDEMRVQSDDVSADYEENSPTDFDEQDDLISVFFHDQEVKLLPGFDGFSIEEEWVAPEEIQDRGFDWHWQPEVNWRYARIKNNRCCWSIYYDWYSRESPVHLLVARYINRQITGNNAAYIAPASSEVTWSMKLRIRYRKSKHFTLTYSNEDFY